jgi:hypothetical protein
MDSRAATLSFQAIHAALAADPKTRDPMNALAVWTELGKGLSGTLDKKGAPPGLLADVIAEHCKARSGDAAVDLARWAYRVPETERLTQQEAAAALRRVLQAIESRLPELSAAAETDVEKERDLFMAVVRGWFPVGLDIVRSLPGATNADEATRVAALHAWCERYLPKDTSEARDLGVRVER